MSIIPILTQTEQDIADKNELILQVAASANSMAAIIASVVTKFFELPTARLLAVLNADVAASISTFELCGILAGASNQALIALSIPRFSNRAPEVRLRSDIQLDTSTMRFVALPAPPRLPQIPAIPAPPAP